GCVTDVCDVSGLDVAPLPPHEPRQHRRHAAREDTLRGGLGSTSRSSSSSSQQRAPGGGGSGDRASSPCRGHRTVATPLREEEAEGEETAANACGKVPSSETEVSTRGDAFVAPAAIVAVSG
ncbi:unnamed protein product, partial [Ectocarpus sp. 12 AP-2014]